MRWKRNIPILFLALLAACADEVSQSSKVDGLRILAIRIDKPEVSPDETVKAEVLIADPKNQAREAQYLWIACPLAFDAEAYQCTTGEETFFSLVVGVNSPEAEFVIPSDMLDPLPGSGVAPEERAVSIGVFVCAGGEIGMPDAGMGRPTGGQTPEPTCEGGVGVFGYKRLVVSRRPSQNRNPKILSVTISDAAESGGMKGYTLDAAALNPVDYCVTQDKCTNKILRITLDKGLIEKYEETILDETQSVIEEPFISWFSTGGKLKNNRSIEPVDQDESQWENTWTPDEDGDSVLWIVARDGRGGTDWISYRMKVAR